MFVAAVVAIESGHPENLERLWALSQTMPEVQRSMRAAFGWVEPDRLRGIARRLLNATDPLRRLTGVAVCAMHRVDPGFATARHFEDSEPQIRARTWRAAAELGRHQLVTTAAAVALAEEDTACQFWAAWAAVLLGDKHNALKLLARIAVESGPYRARAFQTAIQAMTIDAAHRLMRQLAQDSASVRWLIRGAGLVGDPQYVPTLIGFMERDPLARLAGEAFSLITGLDLAWLDLERKPPENFESGPNDDPNNPSVEMDEDDGLPWPDRDLVQAWWNANAHRFQPGVRYFMGEPLNRENCMRVLKEGFQRQRIAAALYLPLLSPGTPLFEWRAPAWRQQRELAQMS
jgi:uncharacterized protein (TIGR02270 family)